MFRRYGSWLLLLCAVALVCVPSMTEPAGRLHPDTLPRPVSAADSHYIEGRDGLRLDLNRATAAELADLPGLGEKLAARIVEYREAHGDFAAVEDVMAVEGIGKGKFEGIAPYLGVFD